MSSITEIADYIWLFKDCGRIEVGDGLISTNSNKKSFVTNYSGLKIISLSEEEYCISAKNGYFLICNQKTDCYYIIDATNEKICSIKTNNLVISEFRNYICYYDHNQKGICILNYAGAFQFKLNTVSFLTDILQIDCDILSLMFNAYFEDIRYTDYLRCQCKKNIVINVVQKKIILQGKMDDFYDSKIITNINRFNLPIKFPNFGDKYSLHYLPTIQYTEVEPYLVYDEYSDEYKPKIKCIVKFSDFLGNLIKKTEYSQIHKEYNGYYIVTEDKTQELDYEDFTLKETLYGILDCNFEPFLPCVFPHLNFNGKELEITENTLLDFTSKDLKSATKKDLKFYCLTYILHVILSLFLIQTKL